MNHNNATNHNNTTNPKNFTNPANPTSTIRMNLINQTRVHNQTIRINPVITKNITVNTTTVNTSTLNTTLKPMLPATLRVPSHILLNKKAISEKIVKTPAIEYLSNVFYLYSIFALALILVAIIILLLQLCYNAVSNSSMNAYNKAYKKYDPLPLPTKQVKTESSSTNIVPRTSLRRRHGSISPSELHKASAQATLSPTGSDNSMA